MSVKLNKISPLSFARLQGLLGALLGFVAGVIYSFGGLIIDTLVTLGWLVTTDTPGLSHGTLLAFGALIGMPLIGLAIGLLAGFVSAILYNLYTKYFDGLELDLEGRMSHKHVLVVFVLILLALAWAELGVGIFGTPWAGS